MSLSINTKLGLTQSNLIPISGTSLGISNNISEFIPFKEVERQQKISLLELVLKGLIKKVMLAIISMSLVSKFLPKGLGSNVFTKLISGFLGYAVAGTAFVKFEDWLEQKIGNLFQNANVASELAAKTISISFLTTVGIAKKWYLVNESFHEPHYNKALSLITNLTKPFELLGKKLHLNINSFSNKDTKNILNTFDNLGEWFYQFASSASKKKILFLPTFSKILGGVIKKIVGWPNWREAIIRNTKPQLGKDIFYKFAYLVPLGVLLEFIISCLHKEAEQEIKQDEL